MSKQGFGYWICGLLLVTGLSASFSEAAECPAQQLGFAAALGRNLLTCAQQYTRRPQDDPGQTQFGACVAGARSTFNQAHDAAIGSLSDCQLTLGSAAAGRLWTSLTDGISDPLLAAFTQPPAIVGSSSRFTEASRNRRFSTIARVLGVGLARRLVAESDFASAGNTNDSAQNTRRTRLKRALTRRLKHLIAGRPDYNGASAIQLADLANSISSEMVRLVSTRTGLTLSIPEATNGLDTTEAADGTPVQVGLPGKFVKAGDSLAVAWGTQAPITITLDAAAISAELASVNIPAATLSAAGTGTINVTATLADAGSAVLAVTNPPVTVTSQVNPPPANNPPVAVADSGVASEDLPLSLSALLRNDSDPDGDSLGIADFTQPSHGSVARDGEIPGTLVYTPAANFTGDDSFTYTISDGKGGTATAAVSVQVTAVNDAPVFTVPGTGRAVTVNLAENLNKVTALEATDAESSPENLTFAISGGADANVFFIDQRTGELNIDTCGEGCAPDFEQPSDADENNVYEVTVSVSDGVLTTTQDISVVITDVPGSLEFTSPGSGAAATVNVAEGILGVARLTAVANETNFQSLTFSIAGGADGRLFFVGEGNTLVLDACQDFCAANFEAPSDADGNNVYEVTVEVTDGTLTATQQISVVISNVDESPFFNSSTLLPTAVEGQAYSFTLSATDPDGQVVAFTATSKPGWMTVTDNGNGTVTLSGVPDQCVTNPNLLTIQAAGGTSTTELSANIAFSQLPTCSSGA